ncbi:MAG TPA: PRC-barrel domain-containing protein [Bradyrhizobium sp.]|nr:PRC-barrel domain-containing protein [Bradyrhizobium sp.]
MRALLLATTAAVALSSAAWAASDNINNNRPNPNLRHELTQMLQKSGYTDIRVAPTSYMVRAKDENGDPVVMSISPDRFAEMTAVDETARSGNNKGAMNTVGSNSSDTYVSVPQADDLSSKVVGLDIYNHDNKDIGTIKDIALNPDGRAAAYIVSVGGFLGMGEHYVAVNPSAVNITYKDSKWQASMNATADQLKSAPEFKYTGHWKSNKA